MCKDHITVIYIIYGREDEHNFNIKEIARHFFTNHEKQYILNVSGNPPCDSLENSAKIVRLQ